MRNTLFQAGANRGGREFVYSYGSKLPQPSGVLVADPKGDRAASLADRWRSRGIDALAYADFCEEVLMDIPEDSVAMLTVDSVRPMVDVIERRPDLPIQWQLVGRGAGRDAPVLGFSGTIVRGDSDAQSSSTLLLDNLSPYASTVSSRHINSDALNARATLFTRRVLSKHSARQISLLDHEPEDIPGGRLNLFFGTEQFPLVVEEGTIEPFKETKKKALEIESPFIDNDRDFAAAIVLTNRVEMFIVERRRRGRGIRFHTTFGDSPLSHSLGDNVSGTRGRGFAGSHQDSGAVVTD